MTGSCGEEGSSDPSESGVRWVVDPIDGTVNFVSGFPQYAVSIGAEIDGVVVAGVVLHVPSGPGLHSDARRRCLAWWRAAGDTRAQAAGRGAGRDGLQLRPRVRRIQAQAAARLASARSATFVDLGSCALDLCHVAEGWFHAYVEEGVNPWDYAAGGLIARECGARTELGTGAGGMTLLMCAPEAGFEEFRDAVVAAGFSAAQA